MLKDSRMNSVAHVADFLTHLDTNTYPHSHYIYSLRFHRFHDDSCSSLSVKSKRCAFMRTRPFISLIRFSAHVRASVTSPNTTLEPIWFRIQTALFCTDTSTHFSMIGHTCEMYVYSRQITNVSRRASRGHNIWSLTELCVTWLDLLSVLSLCCVVCHKLFPRIFPFRFPWRCNVKISLECWRESDK